MKKKSTAPVKPAKARDKVRHPTRAREAADKKPAAVKPRKPTSIEKAGMGTAAGKALAAAAQQLALSRSKPDKTIPAGANDSDTEARIIESLGNPVHRPLTIEQRCELIGISRSTFYRHMQSPTFHARASRAWRECCREQLGAVYEVLINSALIPGRDGHRDRKLLLELLGEVAEGKAGGAGEPVKAGHEMTDDELLAAFEGREELLPPGVLRRLGRDPDAAADVKSKPGKEAHTNAKAREAPKANKARRAR